MTAKKFPDTEIPDHVTNSLAIRDYLLKVIVTNQQALLYRPDLLKSVSWPRGYQGIVNIPNHSSIRYAYAFSTLIFNVFAQKVCANDTQTCSGSSVLYTMMWLDRLDKEGDASYRVNLEAAMVAWLTSDEFRWHKTQPYSFCPEDLCYGLIKQYYRELNDLALFFVGLPWLTIDIDKYLPPELKTYREVIRSAKTKCLKICEELGTAVKECEDAAREDITEWE